MADEPKYIFGVDLDGVCADFYGGIRPLAAEWLGKREEELVPHVTYGLKEWGMHEAPGGYTHFHRYRRQSFKSSTQTTGHGL